MFISYIGYGNIDISFIMMDRYNKKEIKLFNTKPSSVDIVKAHGIVLPECEYELKIYQRALDQMLSGQMGYYYGQCFFLKEILPEEIGETR